MIKKTGFTICLLIVFIFSSSFIIVACNDQPPTEQIPDTPPITETEMVTITYQPYIGGTVDGKDILAFTIPKGSDAPSVSAIPNLGYEFSCWSDGLTDPQRIDKNITEDIILYADFNHLTYTITYNCEEGGHIKGAYAIEGQFDGITEFNEHYGDQIPTITAVPDEDYVFDKWSDGYTEPQRADTVTQSQTFTATFRRVSKTFYYVYNHADENYDEQKIVLNFDAPISAATFAAPKRINSIFKGWYLEKDFKTQVTDETGNLLMGEELYNIDSKNLYAKYELIEQLPTFKILMVYVTEVEGTFELESGEFRYVHYKMTDLERQVCSVLTTVFENKLNDMFCGLVTFDIDELFTQKVVTEKEFSSSYDKKYSLDANKIPEITFDTLDKYRSVLTAVRLGDMYENFKPKEQRLHTAGGIAYHKYGCIYTEGIIQELDDISPYTLYDLLDPSFFQWEGILSSYVHEFTHTVEIGLPDQIYDYHEVIGYYTEIPGSFERFGFPFHVGVANLFLLQQAEIDGKKVGIPYDFWRDEIYFKVNYIAGDGGYIIGNLNQNVKIGRSAETVIAVPYEGYRFIKWTSGRTESEMTYGPVIYSDSEITAIFEEIVIEFKYLDAQRSTPGIWWTYHSEIRYYKDFFTPLWILELDGYEFEGWYLDKELTLPIGDKYGNTAQEDFDAFINYAKKYANSYILFLYPKLSKKQE